ncbi:hypothetical protein BT69DRAFT_1276556 [Atractiella rhizophila]|nr:hypothetical protein BT69DRAFT_1276556 [Atractiella rhizophila]
MAEVVTYFNVGNRKYIRFEERYASKAFLTHVWDTTTSPLAPTDTDGHTLRMPFRIHRGQIEFPIIERLKAVFRGKAIKLRPGEVVEGGEVERLTGDWLSWQRLHEMHSTAVKPPPNLNEFLGSMAHKSKQTIPEHLTKPLPRSSQQLLTPTKLPASSTSTSPSMSKFDDLLARIRVSRESSPVPASPEREKKSDGKGTEEKVQSNSLAATNSVETSTPSPPLPTSFKLNPSRPAFLPTAPLPISSSTTFDPKIPAFVPRSPPSSPTRLSNRKEMEESKPSVSIKPPLLTAQKRQVEDNITSLTAVVDPPPPPPAMSELPTPPNASIPQKRPVSQDVSDNAATLTPPQLATLRTKTRKRGKRRDSVGHRVHDTLPSPVATAPNLPSPTEVKELPKRSSSIGSLESRSSTSRSEEKREAWREGSVSLETEATSVDEDEVDKENNNRNSLVSNLPLQVKEEVGVPSTMTELEASTTPITFEDGKNFLPLSTTLSSSPSPVALPLPSPPPRPTPIRKRSSLRAPLPPPKSFDWAEEVELFSDEEEALPSLDDWLRPAVERKNSLKAKPLMVTPTAEPRSLTVDADPKPGVRIPKVKKKEQSLQPPQRRKIVLGGLAGGVFKRLVKGAGVVKSVEEPKRDEESSTKVEIDFDREKEVRIRLGGRGGDDRFF